MYMYVIILLGFLILMSVAGGTGSGLGTYVTQMLHDEYPTCCLVNPVVWPYASGEVIVQNYNALLTTATLYTSSDALILLPNDHLHKVCSKLLQLKEISFKDLNKVATHILASLLQPAVPYDSSSADISLLGGWCSLSDLCTSLTPHSSYRLLSVKCLPQMPERSHAYTNYLWAGLVKYLRQMLLTDSFIDEGMDWSSSLGKKVKCLSNLFVFRGKDLQELDLSGLLADQSMYSDSVPPPLRQWVWSSPHPFNRYEKSCTVLSNSQSCLQSLNTVTEKAWKMYSSRAYIHQYERFGLCEENFMKSFVEVEQIVKDYSTI